MTCVLAWQLHTRRYNLHELDIMDIGLLFRLPLSTRGYLIYQALGSVLVNLVINFGFAWPMRHHSSIALFGWGNSAAFDTCVTAFLLSELTVLSGSWFVGRDIQRDVVRALSPARAPVVYLLARGTLLRALAFAGLFSAVSIPIAFGVLLARGGEPLTFPQFLRFKLTFAILLGMVVTPLNAALVLAPDPRPAPNHSIANRA